MPKICVIIPCYKHTDKIAGVIQRLLPYGFPIIVVDDGNSKEDAMELYKICENLRDIFLLHHDENKGKGGSVLTGLLFAKENRFTHAIQIDADGQHCVEDIPKITDILSKNPDAVVSGSPIYDDNAPKSRVIGRKITNFFVKIETLSNEIKDAMIGFRAYPVNLTCQCAKDCNLNFGMTFDIEILVRLKWADAPIKFFETQVDYPKNGYSNFKVSDQLKISIIHTVLCTTMLLRLPYVLFKALFKSHDRK
ncbi:glycosyltransferase family 2 protein [Succinivibrio dextrinosolvens]|uniref:glycosyltransferase family 2 protein n=1 Tax=Succinivibrio dextrinosolvens TaxID=83771 RepID=UPI00247A19F4|nr:glycosyltransferase family 2 protein [Succinivibrio dextrinosolvens]